MQKATREIIIRDGIVTGFVDEVCFSGLTVAAIEIQRVSSIVPVRFHQRASFMVLRFIFGDESRAAEWTRDWKCLWEVRIDKDRFGPFVCRTSAIAFEKSEIYRRGVLEQTVLHPLGAAPR